MYQKSKFKKADAKGFKPSFIYEERDREFVHKEVLKIFPWINPRTLISWSERGLITPDFDKGGAGRGIRRRYSYFNLLEIAFVDELLTYGMPFSVIKAIIEEGNVGEQIRRKGCDLVFVYNSAMNATRFDKNKKPAPMKVPGQRSFSPDWMSPEEFIHQGSKELLQIKESRKVKILPNKACT